MSGCGERRADAAPSHGSLRLVLHVQFKAISVSYGILASTETRQEHDEAVRVSWVERTGG